MKNVRNILISEMTYLVSSLIFFLWMPAFALAVINGTEINPEESGFVKMADRCSGTLLNNQWVLSARHCSPKLGRLKVQMGSQETEAVSIIHNPGSVGYIARLKEPFTMNGSPTNYVREIFKGTDDDLIGNLLSCSGYGNNVGTSLNGISGFGVLRNAILQVGPDEGGRCGDDCFIIKRNQYGQILSTGDSGSSCLLENSDGDALITGILWGSSKVSSSEEFSSTLFRGWAIDQMNRDQFASSLALGDFDGDGERELVVGFPGSLTEAGDLTGSVIIYKHQNDASGNFQEWAHWRTLTAFDSAIPGEPFDQFGYALTVGDFNNDGREDLAIGAPGREALVGQPKSGLVYIYLGSAKGLEFEQFLSGRWAANKNARFGSSLVSADFDNDNYDDIAVGAPGEKTIDDKANGAGIVHIYSGDSERLLWDTGLGLDIKRSSFGHVMSTGDFDGNGQIDLAVSAPNTSVGNARTLTGVVYLFRKKELKARSKPWKTLKQENGDLDVSQPSELFGWSLASGDFNDDGVSDLAVGTPREKNNSRAGAVFIYKGDRFYGPKASQYITQAFIKTVDNGILISPPEESLGVDETQDWFGAVLSVGNFDGIGGDDLAIGAPAKTSNGYHDSGQVFVYAGSSVGGLASWRTVKQEIVGISEKSDWFGAALFAGKIYNTNSSSSNLNLRDHLVVGATGESFFHNSDRGFVYHYSNKNEEFDEVAGISADGSNLGMDAWLVPILHLSM